MATDHYATVDDVNAIVPQAPFSSTSVPTEGDIAKLIEVVALRIDATIGNLGYVVPVTTGAKSLALLRDACAKGALGEAQMRRQTGVNVATDDRGRPIKNYWTQEFECFLEKLADPQDSFELPDAQRTDEQVIKSAGDLVLSSGLDETDTLVDAPAITRQQTL